MAGLSIERKKIDLLEAYAILSPFASADSGVGCPRVVFGRAAKMLSVKLDQRHTGFTIRCSAT